MNNINIAIMQIKPLKSIQENLDKGVRNCIKAKEMGADIILFPEMWSNGYNLNEGFEKDAITLHSKFIESFKELAKKLEVAIGITFLEKTDDKPKNSIAVINYKGEIVLHYSKVHTCDFGDEINLSSGDNFYTTNLETKKGNVCVGAMICYDREFPESARILMLKGAEIILVPNACPMEINRISQLRGRAYENMLAIVTVNYPSQVPDCNGHSTAFDGIAYKEGISGSRDTKICETGEEETIMIASIPIDEIRNYREKEVHGNCYRHPAKYQELIKEEIKYPFIRSDYRK